jgi:hypothetical protein
VDNGVALIKVFDRIPSERQAPGEAAIEIFASGEKDYVELEQQGAYSKVGPWKALTWKVLWMLRPVPSGLSVRVGSDPLLHWIESVC